MSYDASLVIKCILISELLKYKKMSHHLRISEVLKLTFNEPLLLPSSLTNKQIRINNLILMITLLVCYSHFTDEGSGPTETSTFMYCVAEFRFFCLTINYKEIKSGNPKGNQS